MRLLPLFTYLIAALGVFVVPHAGASPKPQSSVPTHVQEQESQALHALSEYSLVLSGMDKPKNEARMCKILHSAKATQQRVGQALQSSLDLARSEDNTKKMDEFTAFVANIPTMYPGIGIAVGSETVHHSVDYAAFLPIAPATKKDLLGKAAQFWQQPAGQPSYWQAVTDATMCIKPQQLADAIEAFGMYPRDTSCMNKFFRWELQRAVAEVQKSTCFCDSENETNNQLTRLQRLAKEAKLLPRKSANSKMNVDDNTVQPMYECRPN